MLGKSTPKVHGLNSFDKANKSGKKNYEPSVIGSAGPKTAVTTECAASVATIVLKADRRKEQ